MVEDPRQPGEAGPPGERPENPSVRREGTDVSFRWILGTIIFAMLFAAWVHIILLVFYGSYADYQKDIKTSPYPLARELPSTGVPTLPPEPRLEEVNRLSGVERSNVYERQETREQRLESYGPTEETGYAHVPIDEAIKHLTNKLPSRRAAPADRHRQNGLVDGGESNSGRMFREEPLWSER